ncbi:hypothetical protein, partial [Komagataeibacter saccharivorans]|uniref:hypothetical protein n=1 Tax=Komagataeibacter saccharivorans TaxID=265959 RepID=UPI0039E7B0D0
TPPFHGGNTGSNPVRDAKPFKGLHDTQSIRRLIQVENLLLEKGIALSQLFFSLACKIMRQ